MPRPVLVLGTPGEHGRDALTLGVNIARPLGAPIVLANVARTHGRHHAQEREMLLDHLVRLRERAPSDLEVSVDVLASPSQLRGLHDLAVAHDAQILVTAPSSAPPSAAPCTATLPPAWSSPRPARSRSRPAVS